MVSLIDLPPEILYYLFEYTETPLDYYHLCMVHPLLHRIGHEFSTRYSFLLRTLIEDCDNIDSNFNSSSDNLWSLEPIENNTLEQLMSPQQSYRSIVCRFLATSPTPLSSSFAIDLLEMVPTTHFYQFSGYPSISTKRMLLQSFRHRSSSYQSQYRHRRRPISNNNVINTQLTIPTLSNKATMATALTCNRHRVMGGAPRRVYYHVTLHKPFNFDPPFIDNKVFCLMHDTDTVVGFDHQLVAHHGKLWYEDEGIITDSSWSSLLEVTGSIHMEYRDIRPSPVGYYDHHKTTYHRGWRPCLLKTLFDCRLKLDVRKGGLRKGDRFDCVFVYEHREDDTICLEFCSRDKQRWVPQGFLLFTEHHIVWSS